MQTFLPYPDFEASASVLDNKRLGKQRVENLQIMTALVTGRGWVHHPATRMWAGYENALLAYHEAICREWTVIRGYQDTCWGKVFDLISTTDGPWHQKDFELPPWLGLPQLHLGYQSNLVRKNEDFYRPIFGGVPADLEYYWPV